MSLHLSGGKSVRDVEVESVISSVSELYVEKTIALEMTAL